MNNSISIDEANAFDGNVLVVTLESIKNKIEFDIANATTKCESFKKEYLGLVSCRMHGTEACITAYENWMMAKGELYALMRYKELFG